MDNVLSCVLMAAITFPVSFLAARTCLRGVIRLVTGHPSGVADMGGSERDVL